MEMSVIVDGIRPQARPAVLLEKLTEASALVARSGRKDPVDEIRHEDRTDSLFKLD